MNIFHKFGIFCNCSCIIGFQWKHILLYFACHSNRVKIIQSTPWYPSKCSHDHHSSTFSSVFFLYIFFHILILHKKFSFFLREKINPINRLLQVVMEGNISIPNKKYIIDALQNIREYLEYFLIPAVQFATWNIFFLLFNFRWKFIIYFFFERKYEPSSINKQTNKKKQKTKRIIFLVVDYTWIILGYTLSFTC